MNIDDPEARLPHIEGNGGGAAAEADPMAGAELLPPEPDNTAITAAEWERLRQDVAGIRLAMEQERSALQQKDLAFNRLYEELDAYKRANAFQDLKPLYIDLILLYDRMHTANQQCESGASAVLGSLQQELLEILYRRDIEQAAPVSDAFDPAIQRAVGSQPVDTAELQGKVLSVLREGFTYRGSVLRPQEVIIGKFQA
jgi:molecular chaperone GrpE